MVRRQAVIFLLASALFFPSASGQVDIEPEVYRFTYDSANNLTSRIVETGGMVTTESFPSDPSGRNRPISIGDVSLAWDNNGNLIQKGDLHFAFDYRNRLVQIRDAGGQILSFNEYDALGRRVRQTIGGDVIETVWKDWQPVETYINGVLASRRIYGVSIDEIVYLEQDLDLDGTMDTRLHPIYDHSGNLAVVTGGDGKPIERYSYDPYGRQRIYVDATRPEIDQVLVAEGEVRVEMSEAIIPQRVESGIASGAVRLEAPPSPTAYALTTEAPFLHRKRHRLVLVPDPLPEVGTELALTFEPQTLVDVFHNQPSVAEVITFSWPENAGVVFDRTPPEVVEVKTTETALEVEFSQLIDPVEAGPHISLSGMTADWAVASSTDPYRLKSLAPVPAGTYLLVISTALSNMAGRGMAEPFTLPLTVNSEGPLRIAYREPDSREITESSVGSAFGFHGLERDPLTGFVYMRNRYYDPEMGRFITADPMGYVDGPSPYAFAGNNPIDNRDPLGLYQTDFHLGMTEFLAREAGFSRARARAIALSAQRPDDDLRDPLVTGRVLRARGLYSQQREHEAAQSIRQWHFPLTCPPRSVGINHCQVVPGSVEARQEVTLGIATGNLRIFSEGLHVLQDSFSHQGIPGWAYQDAAAGIYAGYGHPDARGGPLRTRADLPNEFPQDALAAADATFEALLQWRIQNDGLSTAGADALRTRFTREIRPQIDEWSQLQEREEREAWLIARGIALE